MYAIRSYYDSWMMGSFTTMPATGELKIAPGTSDDPDSGYRSRINNDNTVATAGYYSRITSYNVCYTKLLR